uniref:UBX domain-containing protein 4 n=1 Tax=Sphenodon punctatus TaxID=8508 RepID=A0A8D0HB08_SPHPU
MGFTELQVRAAIRAGSLSVQEATDWLLQERGQRLQIGAPRVPGGAMAAFNPPKCQEGPAASSPEHSLPGVGTGSPPRPGEAAMQSSQARVPRQGFEEQEQLAQEAKAERATKRKEHELALQRIADDRRSLQAKAHFAQKLEPSPAQAPLVAGSDGQQCLLMIRLPSGDSVRERFPATFPLQCVHQHVLSLHPELPPAFTFLQGFPKRHFGPAELPSSLQALGLTPSATLCVLGAELPQPAAEREPESPGPPPRRPQALPIEHAWGRGEALVEEALGAMAEGGFPLSDGGLLLTPAHRVVLDSPLRVHGLWESAFPTHHHWGQGQRLVPQDPLGRDEPGEEEEELPLPDLRQAPSLNRSRGSPASPHQWPAGGNRLRAVDTGDRGGEDRSPELPVAAAQAAEQRLHQGAVRDREDEKGRPVAAVSPQGRLPLPVPSLFHMALQAAIALLTAPRKQYCSSLSALTAPLAECLFTHMIQQGLLRPRSLELFFSCPLQTLRLDCYPYATNALLHQLRALPSLRHLSLVACSLITGECGRAGSSVSWGGDQPPAVKGWARPWH